MAKMALSLTDANSKTMQSAMEAQEIGKIGISCSRDKHTPLNVDKM